MKIVFLAFFICNTFLGYAQSKNYDIVASYGVYVAPALKQNHSKNYLLADFNYNFRKKWTIVSGFTTGQFNYYDDVHSNAYDEVTKYTTATTNARGYDLHTYVLVKYSFVRTQRLLLRIGAGIGMLNQRLKYPYREPCSSGCAVFIGETSSTTLDIPIKLDASFSLIDQLSIGVTGGTFINANKGNIGVHFGPQVLISL